MFPSRTIPHGLDQHRRPRAHRSSVVSGKLPSIVAAPSVRDDLARHILDDELLSPHAELRFDTQMERGGIPPDDAVAAILEAVCPGTDGRRTRHFFVWPPQHGVPRFENGTLRTARG